MSDLPDLSPWQSWVWNSRKRHWLLWAGRRKGKSFVCARKGVQYAVNGYTTVWYCANRQTADKNWNAVVNFCRPFATRVNAVSVGLMEFDNPEVGTGYFMRESAFNEDTAGRGGETDCLVLDEAQLLTHHQFNSILPSMATSVNKRICATLTAPATPDQHRDAQWLKEILDTANEDGESSDPRWKNWLISKSPTTPDDIAFVYKAKEIARGRRAKPWREYLRMAEESMEEDKWLMGEEAYDREYNLIWTLNAEGLIYAFEDGIHCHEKFDYTPGSDVFWACDRGEGGARSVILFFQRVKAGEKYGVDYYKYVVFDEMSTMRVSSEDELLNEALIISSERGYRVPLRVYHDPRAPGFRMACYTAGLSPYSCNTPIESGIGVVRRVMRRGMFGINPRCSLLKATMSRYRRDHRGEPEDKNVDAADALRYGIYQAEKLGGYLSDVVAENRELVEAGEGAAAESVMLLRL